MVVQILQGETVLIGMEKTDSETGRAVGMVGVQRLLGLGFCMNTDMDDH